MVRMRPSQLVHEILELNGEQYSIDDYPYLEFPYDVRAREFCLFTARQIGKSTLLASKLVANAVTRPRGRQILVSPLQEQAYVFSMQRLADFTTGSPIVKDHFFTGPGVVNQVLRKVFNNGHMITLGYAQRTADRLRGQSISGKGVILGFDELQDILPDVIPVVKEMAFRTEDPSFLYAGTPKSFSNHMEKLRRQSTACEWAVKCHHMGCGFWNLEWTEENIGNRHIICTRCGGKLNTNRGEWVRARELDLDRGRDSQVTAEAVRIPQLIVKPIMDDPYKYRELLNKLSTYSTEKFRNEVLGLPYDSAAQPVTYDQVARCCDSSRPNAMPLPGQAGVPPLVAGLDWAFTGETSFTYLVVGGWRNFPFHFDVFFHKIFRGHEVDTQYQIDYVSKLLAQHPIKIMGADWGAGLAQNLELIRRHGEARIAQMFHTAMKTASAGGARVRWESKTRKYHLSRTQVLTDTLEGIRRAQFTFPRVEECKDLIDHILAERLEYLEDSGRVRYVNLDPDDALHALTYATLAGELYMQGDFTGHQGQESTQGGGVMDMGNMGYEDDGWGVADDYYG